jgi:hypothetical protein
MYSARRRLFGCVLSSQLRLFLFKYSFEMDQQLKEKCLYKHPLVSHKISLLRDRATPPKQFREILSEISVMLGVRATQNLDLIQTKTVCFTRGDSPLETCSLMRTILT